MESFYISRVTNRVYLRIFNPEKKKFEDIYTGYHADEPITEEEAEILRETVIEKLERSRRYLYLALD